MALDESLSRRSFTRRAVALGGIVGLSACLGDDEELDAPRGGDLDALPESQHAWNDYLIEDDDGNVLAPEHHVLLSYSLSDDPSEELRSTMEEALRTLERAFEWSNEGLVFTVGYTAAYFDRFDDELPDSVDVPAPSVLTSMENPDRLDLDTDDLLIHLASDDPAVVLASEEALDGELDELNGESVKASLSPVFERTDRRTGFIGAGLPAEKQAEDEINGLPRSDIHEDAPFWMGFRAGFRESQASEAAVSIGEGPFAEGTTQHVESLRLQLRAWFDQDDQRRRTTLMFSPEHDVDEVGEIGENLGTSSGALAAADRVEEHARSGAVGHAQKAARARENGVPLLLRRDFNTIDGSFPGVHFISNQRTISDFEEVRLAMAGEDLPVSFENNGILQYLTVLQRGNFLVPPRRHRALPSPDPE